MGISLDTEIRLIEKFFADYGLAAKINKASSFMAGKSFVVLSVALGTGMRINALESRIGELNELLSAYRGWPTPVRLRRLPLALEVPHPKPEPLAYTGVIPPAHAALLGKGFDYKGEADQIWRFDDSPHALIAGTTGSGKSKLLALMIYSLALGTAPDQLRFFFVDLKNEDLLPFANLPHTERMALSLDEAVDVIGQVHREKERRIRSGKGDYARHVLVIDELAEMTRAKTVMNELASILAIGRSKNINVIAATQKPTAKIVGSVAKANFTTRLVGKVTSPSDAEVASGLNGTQAHFLPGRGAFLRIHGDQVDRFQAYLLEDLDLTVVANTHMAQGYLLDVHQREFMVLPAKAAA